MKRKRTLAHAMLVSIATKNNFAERITFLPAILMAMMTCTFLNSTAQTGVTRLGTSALASNNVNGIYNTGLGYFSLNANTSGNKNTATGANTLRANTTGVNNTASGYAAIYANTTGGYNTAFGAYSLFSNTTGYQNTAIGDESLYYNTTGNSNTAVGYFSLNKNTTGSANTALGFNSLLNNTTGYFNTSNGYYSMYTNTTGYNNTAIGHLSLGLNTTGYNNTATGRTALYNNTTGFGNTASGYGSLGYNTSGTYNTAVGFESLNQNTTGFGNTANGKEALRNNTTGGSNTASGYAALGSNTTGSYNTTVGYNSLYQNTTGIGNTALGNYANVSTGNLSNATVIGYTAVVDASNKVRIGNTSVTSIGGQVSWTTFSDGRYKKDVKEDVPGLAFINNLRPVTYTVNVRGLNEYFSKESKLSANDNNETINTELQKAEEAAGKIVYNGFLAQEVEEAAKQLNFDFSGVDKPQSKDGLYGLRYDNFVVPLVKAVQELSSQNENLKNQIDAQQKININLQEQIDELKTIILKEQNTTINKPFEKANPTKAILEQNSPNPFSEGSIIKYNMPDHFTKASITVNDISGKTIQQFAINATGAGAINIRAGSLSSGTYTYSLWVDGRQVNTKKMIITK